MSGSIHSSILFTAIVLTRCWILLCFSNLHNSATAGNQCSF